MNVKNKVLIAFATIIIVGALSFGGYILFNKINDKQDSPKEDKIPEINQEEHNEETSEKEKDYSWNGVYSNENMTNKIIMFEGYGFMYTSQQSGILILEEKSDQLLTFQNDLTIIKKENGIIMSSALGAYEHYAGTYSKENFENHWSGDYKLNHYDLRLRQISDDEVFYRIINNKEDKETHDIAKITKSGLVDSRITIRKLYDDSDVELTIKSTDLEYYFKDAQGLYILNN